MTCLDEFSEDTYLDSGEKLEETLSSVNYDVWQCPGCNMHTIERHARWFSSYGQCPSCNYKTLRETCQTVENPSYLSTGRKLVTKTCQNCNYQKEDTIILPMLTRTESHLMDSSGSSSFSSGGGSGGGGSFGGGSSSGGGASGSW